MRKPSPVGDYSTFFGIDPRTAVWFVAELHLMFAAIVLGVPIFAVVVEIIGAKTGEERYDRLAHEFTRLLSAAFATTAALGGLLSFVLIGLYPTFTTQLTGIFKGAFFVYGLLFFGEAFCLYYYYYSWKRLKSQEPRNQPLARGIWLVFLLVAVAWIGLFLFGGEDLDSIREHGQVEAERVENWADQLKPWFKKGVEDEEDIATYLATPMGKLVDYDIELAGGSGEESIRTCAEALLTAAIEMAAERKVVTVENAEEKLESAAALIAADLKMAASVEAANASEGHWRLLLLVGLLGAMLSLGACWASSAKAFHIWFGIALNGLGTALLLIANSWATYMMSPTGVHEVTNQFVGTTWQAIANPLWHPVNLHRVLANVVLGGFVAGAYAAVKMLGAKTEEDRAHYDWMGYVGNFVGMCAMIPLPFAGYWLGREVYSYSPIMGNNMMGGAFSWTFILQALLIGMLFFGANYYLWIGMQRIEGAERYRKFIPWNTAILVVSFAIWLTPHNLPLSAMERAMMAGESFHPVLKYFGLMPAKNAVVNFIIVSTFFSFLMYRRCNLGKVKPFSEQGTGARIVLLGVLAAVLATLGWYANVIWHIDPVSISVKPESRWIFLGAGTALLVEAGFAIVSVLLTFLGRGKVGQSIYFASTVLLVTFFLGVWGFVAMTDASQFLRNIAVCQVLMVLTCLVLNSTIDVLMLRDAEVIGGMKWGHIPNRGAYTLIWNCLAVVMLMGLMGFIRSGLREDWHIYGVMRDISDWAWTPPQATMTLNVSIITFIFLGLVAFVFWLADLAHIDDEEEAPAPAADTGSMAQISGEV